MYTLDDFLDLAEKLILLFDDLTDIEQTKLEAVTEKNIDSLNECMKEEQAYLLQFRGLDKKREAIQKDLGVEKKKFSEIISMVEDKKYKEELEELFATLKETMDFYQQIHNNVKHLVEINLHSIDKTLEYLKHSSALGMGDTYSSDGQFHHVDTKITLTNKRI